MNLTDIAKILEKNYNLKTSPQTIYNWCKKYDLLKYRGKGRNLSSNKVKGPKSPAQKLIEQRRKEMRKQNELKKKGKLR